LPLRTAGFLRPKKGGTASRKISATPVVASGQRGEKKRKAGKRKKKKAGTRGYGIMFGYVDSGLWMTEEEKGPKKGEGKENEPHFWSTRVAAEQWGEKRGRKKRERENRGGP